MQDDFKLYSELYPEAKKILQPDLGLRNWEDLTLEEKTTMHVHILHGSWLNNLDKLNIIVECIITLNNMYKYSPFGSNMFIHGPLHILTDDERLSDQPEDLKYNKCCYNAALNDLTPIFLNKSHYEVLEFLSLYSKQLNKKDFLQFKILINYLFKQFGVNLYLTPQGFVPRQEDKITENIYDPVLKVFSNQKWEPVSRELSDSFKEYLKHTPESYSNSITHSVSALQAFLQILNNKKLGEGKIKDLVSLAIRNGFIQDDTFSRSILNNFISFFSTERQETSDAHPKKDYANEKNAILVLNLLMVFFQHCLQN